MGLTGVVVGIDGGGSKTDAVAATPAGEIVARRRIGTTSPHLIGVDASAKLVVDLVTEVCGEAPPLAVAVYLSGLDLPSEVSTYRAALQRFGWPGLLLVDNDVFALLRAGTQQPDAVAVVCGTGINAVGLRADGATVRFPALGSISGDWGGGHGLGQEALWYAARAEDGRGEPTALVAVVCAEFGVSSIVELTEQLHVGRRDHGELSLLSPAVFVAAAAGDPVATALVDRLAAEIVTMAGTCLRRLDLLEREVPVVLASSKTGAEIAGWQARMGLGRWPAIVENGAALLEGAADDTGYRAIRAALDALPARLRTRFRGFGDMSAAEVADVTGLPPDEAARAKQRAHSEPGLWSGTGAEAKAFLAALAPAGISARRGGRSSGCSSARRWRCPRSAGSPAWSWASASRS